MDQNIQKRPNYSLLYSFYATPCNTSASSKENCMARKTKNSSMANSKATLSTATDIPLLSKVILNDLLGENDNNNDNLYLQVKDKDSNLPGLVDGGLEDENMATQTLQLF
jgi:hypothetical protein